MIPPWRVPHELAINQIIAFWHVEQIGDKRKRMLAALNKRRELKGLPPMTMEEAYPPSKDKPVKVVTEPRARMRR